MTHRISIGTAQSSSLAAQAAQMLASGGDPILKLARDYHACRRQREALMDERLQPDDPEKLDCVLTMLDANVILSQYRLEHTPPASLEGFAILLRHALSINSDPNVAAVLKSCLAALIGDPQADDGDGSGEGEPAEDTFDDIVTWTLDG